MDTGIHGIQGYRDTGRQGDSELVKQIESQGYRDTGIQGTGIQGTGIQG